MKKVKIKYSLWIVCLLLAGAVQMRAVDYKSTYRGMQQERQQTEYKETAPVSTPAVGFQSTSSYSSQLGEGEQPMLNSDGTVNDGAYMSSSEHHRGHLRKDGVAPNPGEPEGEGNTEDGPIGDAVLPLMMLALAFVGYKYFRSRKTA